MATIIGKAKLYFDLKTILIGITAALTLYLALFLLALFGAHAKLTTMEAELTSHSIQLKEPEQKSQKAHTDHKTSNSHTGQTHAEKDEPHAHHNAEHTASTNQHSAHQEHHDEEKAHHTPINIAYDKTLTENRKGLTLPIIRNRDKNTFYKEYRKEPIALVSNQEKAVAFIFTNAGKSKNQTNKALSKLPEIVTFTVSPYAQNIQDTLNSLRSKGHEVWLELPVETQEFPKNDPGPLSLLSRLSYEKNEDNLFRTLHQAQGYVGVTAFTDNSFRKNQPVLGALFRQIFERGLGYAELNSFADDKIKSAAKRYKAPYTKSQLNFEMQKGERDITAFLKIADSIIHNNTLSIITLPISNQTIEGISEYIEVLQRDNIAIVPLSQAIDLQNLPN